MVLPFLFGPTFTPQEAVEGLGRIARELNLRVQVKISNITETLKLKGETCHELDFFVEMFSRQL